MPHPVRVAVLASGGGTNLQSLIDRFNSDPAGPASVELVVASRPGIGAMERASAAGIEAVLVDPREEPDTHAARLLTALETRRIELVVLAGYLQLIPAELVERYRGWILNIHPALLPAFGGPGMYGIRVHRAVLEAGARVSGATVHLVDERYDEGAILAQWPVPVLPGDTPDTLAARVLAVEHVLLPAAVEALALRLRGGAGILRRDQSGAVAFELRDRTAPDAESIRRFVLAVIPAPTGTQEPDG